MSQGRGCWYFGYLTFIREDHATRWRRFYQIRQTELLVVEPNYHLNDLSPYIVITQINLRGQVAIGVGKGQGPPPGGSRAESRNKITLRSLSCKSQSDGEALLVKRSGEFRVSG